MRWRVWEPVDNGWGERTYEADDAQSAAEAFMREVEDTGDLAEWIENGLEIDLLVQADTPEALVLEVVVTVDFSPTFTAGIRI